jgi:hypothetical protein
MHTDARHRALCDPSTRGTARASVTEVLLERISITTGPASPTMRRSTPIATDSGDDSNASSPNEDPHGRDSRGIELNEHRAHHFRDLLYDHWRAA